MLLFVLIGILAGACLPLQTGVNTVLDRSLGSTIRVGLASCLIGLAGLLVVDLATGLFAATPWSLLRGEPLWVWIGGSLGTFTLIANILVLPRIGSTQTVIFPVLGQILMGMLVDALGLFRATVLAPTGFKIAGAFLVFAGVLMVTLLRGNGQAGGQQAGGNWASFWLWRLVALVAGMTSATQTAINARLATLASPLFASTVSFGVATLCLVVVVLILLAAGRRPAQGRRQGSPWWAWTGGLLGAIFVVASAWLAPLVGTGMTIIVMLVGSMVGGLFLDQFGLLGAARRPLTLARLAGVVIMLVGVGMIRLS